MATRGKQLVSLLKPEGVIEVSLADIDVPPPGPDEVVVRLDAAPINPSDLGLLLGPADLETATSASGALSARVPLKAMSMLAARVGQALPVGNEGAGTVIAAGNTPAAQAMVGKVVAVFGNTFAEYKRAKVHEVFELPPGTSAEAGASSFVNPLTALCFLETMRRENHTALVNTAAASNLGQMLVRLCKQDGVPLVNIVRSAAQVELLRNLGAEYVLDSTTPDFTEQLTNALAATGATIAFDAIAGGSLASTILGCMEAAINRGATTYSRYGSATHKQVYLYGVLDQRPTEIGRSFGLSWGAAGWLVMPVLTKLGVATGIALRERIGRELTTTFASHYSHRISLAQALELPIARGYAKRATGDKYLLVPSRG